MIISLYLCVIALILPYTNILLFVTFLVLTGSRTCAHRTSVTGYIHTRIHISHWIYTHTHTRIHISQQHGWPENSYRDKDELKRSDDGILVMITYTFVWYRRWSLLCPHLLHTPPALLHLLLNTPRPSFSLSLPWPMYIIILSLLLPPFLLAHAPARAQNYYSRVMSSVYSVIQFASVRLPLWL